MVFSYPAISAEGKLGQEIAVCSSNPDYYIEAMRRTFEKAGLSGYTILDGRRSGLINAGLGTTYYYVGSRTGAIENSCVLQYPQMVEAVSADVPAINPAIFGKGMQPGETYTTTTVSQGTNPKAWMVSYCFVTDEICGPLIADGIADLVVDGDL